jgi:hypothetical protein
MQNAGNAIHFFMEKCTPLLKISTLVNPGAEDSPPRLGVLSPSDYANIGAAPPGIFRHVVGEEWATFVEETRAR